MNTAGSRSNEIRIAIIGAVATLLGVIATAAFTNWDKMFPHTGVVQATYTGYRPTGKFETELRYFNEITGARAQNEAFRTSYLEQFRKAMLDKGQDVKKVNAMLDFMKEEFDGLTQDKFIELVLPVYQKYYTLEEMQELNKFYSTEIMQQKVAKDPLVQQALAPTFMKLQQEMIQRMMERMGKLATEEEKRKLEEAGTAAAKQTEKKELEEAPTSGQ